MSKKNIIIALLILAVTIAIGANAYINTLKNNRIYHISSPEELINLSNRVENGFNYSGCLVVLDNDINLSEGINFYPIGTKACPFDGTFDGNGHHIYNLNCSGIEDAGLFGYVSGTILNIVIEDGFVEGSEHSGGIAAVLCSSGKILNSVCLIAPSGNENGGIVSKLEGELINCITYNLEENHMKLFADGKKRNVQNCYTAKGGFYEFYNKCSEETANLLMQNAVGNLNRRVVELTVENQELSFCKWSEGDVIPNLSVNKMDVICGISINDEFLDYSAKKHGFIGYGKVGEIKLLTNSGKTIELSQNDDCDTLIYEYDGGEYTLYLNDFESDNAESYQVDADNLKEGIIERCTFLSADYVYAETNVYLKKPGKYHLKGNLVGRVIVDAPMDSDEITLVLDNFECASKRGPALLVWAESDKNISEKGVTIELLDETSNVVAGVMDLGIYAERYEHEGALEVINNLHITGAGKLKVRSDLEGIESQNNVVIDGGDYDIECYDDGISCSTICINDGYFNIKTTDDLIDSDTTAEINGGFITGFTNTESVLNAEPSNINGGTVIAVSKGGIKRYTEDYGGKSKQRIIQLHSEKPYPDNKWIVMAKVGEKPHIAIKTRPSVYMYSMAGELVEDGEYEFFIADSVDGIIVDDVCIKPDNFSGYKKITHDGKDSFEVEENITYEID